MNIIMDGAIDSALNDAFDKLIADLHAEMQTERFQRDYISLRLPRLAWLTRRFPLAWVRWLNHNLPPVRDTAAKERRVR